MSDELYNELMGDVEATLETQEALQQYTNYGKLTIDTERIQWLNKKPIRGISSEAYQALPLNQRQMDIVLKVDIQEFKPELQFTYKRKIAFGKKEWYDILEPSLVECFHLLGEKKELTKLAVKALFDASGKYVFVNDVPNKAGKMYNEKLLKYPALTHVFESREALAAAVQERFGGEVSAASNSATEKTAYSTEIINAVKTLVGKGTYTDAGVAAQVGLTESDVQAIKQL